MFDHVIKVAFVVEDVAQAVEFYTQTLDLEVEARYPSGAGQGEDFVFLKSKTIYVELLPRKAMGGAPVGFHHLAFKADNVDTRLAELKRRGATITAEAFDAGVGGIRLGDFEGPGGVLLRLFSKPGL
ncbi:MAG: Glyoxalase-like domain protein [candidate division BRC1 bacterium ADurb.BinA364]|nr:MAG: Glyoxalase-like domain protein [candidate division BRC1 bacterium ADurb.BinA364]